MSCIHITSGGAGKCSIRLEKVVNWSTQHTLHCSSCGGRGGLSALSCFDGTIITLDRKELFGQDAHCAQTISNKLAGDALEQYVMATMYGSLDQVAKNRAEKLLAEQTERLRTGNGVVAPISGVDGTCRLD